ncbi:hypothetical protein INT47_001688 [Mucor saturninus]|uniref:Uncharacterized protein n=1 Tax=Mucor saturninus TaxID=64648 RepID=A0A8H7RKP9_9FUNG|nr:hypothetical protein INT47_001688 [Mucor saturninus]
MKTSFELFDYVISIDIGTTFSGSCFSYVKDNKSIVHVIKWPNQRSNDTFEKTPTACLYNKETPPQLLKWGKDATNYLQTNPNDPNVVFVEQFKLNLKEDFCQQAGHEKLEIYRIATIDFLREINKYTCDQLNQTVDPDSSSDHTNKCRYVLTVPATWVDKDILMMRDIAIKANLIDASHDPEERLIIIDEAHAASLFCKREYCMMDDGSTSKLSQGERYMVCDAGGGTVDLATYECTGSEHESPKISHCQLALESGGYCGSTFLDKNMERYLRDHVFIGCIEENVVRFLIDQFVNEIKLSFGGNNAAELNSEQTKRITKLSEESSSSKAVITTTEHLKMMNIDENDYNYNEEYPDFDECMEDASIDDNSINMSEDEIDYSEDDNGSCDFDTVDEIKALSSADYVYFTLPESEIGMDQNILETLSLKGDIVVHNGIKQLRISKINISKYVFDPIIEEVIALIEKQISKSHTIIDTLFLLGGFGQSPYLHKKLHEEFITSSNTVKNLIVPEDGYRASMRGGVYYGIDCVESIPKLSLKDDQGNCIPNPNLFFRMLVAIDVDMHNLNATYSFVKLEDMNSKHAKYSLAEKVVKKTLLPSDGELCQIFSFDYEGFIADYFTSLVELLLKYAETIFIHSELPNIGITPRNIVAINEELYNSFLADSFFRQLLRQVAQDLESDPNRLPQISWNLSIAPPSPKNDAQQNSMNDMKNKLCVLLAQAKPEFEENALMTLCNYVFDIWNDRNAGCLKKFSLGALSKLVDETSTEVGDLAKGRSMFKIHRIYQSTIPFPAYRYFPTLTYLLMEKGVLSFFCSPYTLVNNRRTDIFKERSWLPQSTSIDIAPEDKPYDVYTFDLTGETKTGYVINYDKKYLRPNYNQLGVYSLKLKTENIFYDRSLQEQEDKKLFANRVENKILFEDTIFRLGSRINFMTPEVSTYIKNNVDLSKPSDTHILEELFGIPADDDESAMNLWYRKLASDVTYNYVLHNIRRLRFSLITTELIENLMIIPWIKHLLAPAIVNLCATRRAKTVPDSEVCCLLFTVGEIVETKNKGLSPKTVGSSVTCASFLLDIFNESLESSFAENKGGPIPHRIIYDDSPKNGRHMDIVINSILLDTMNIDVKRIARRTYAVHFLSHNVKKPLTPQTPFEMLPGSKLISAEDNLALYPLIKKDQDFSDTTKRLNSNFYVGDECSLAAGKNKIIALMDKCLEIKFYDTVLYASEDNGNQDNFISNASFKKLHRFIIPIKDASKPIIFTHVVKEYSILFTVKHDGHEADFEYGDLLYVSPYL